MDLPIWPSFSAEEIALVNEVLQSGRVNYWTGTNGKAFEQEFAAYSGVDFGVAVANGSVGLTAALKALNIGSGDEVIVTPRSFIASVSAIAMEGATPVFAEVDADSQNITAESIRAVISPNSKAIICVHLSGWPCDMPAIMQLAEEHGLKVIEDCAQAHGARVAGKPVGAWGDVGVFSFCQDKIMSTGGEGGMVISRDREVWEKLWALKDHGKSYTQVSATDAPSGFRWLHESFGTNFRLTEMQSALGRWQLKQLDTWVTARRRNAQILETAFAGIDCVRITPTPADVYHSYYKYYAFIRPEKLKNAWNRDRIIAEFSERGIPGLSGSCPEIYLEGAFTAADAVTQFRLPVARELGETSIMFQVHPTLDAEHMEFVAAMAKQVFVAAQSS
jgi:dTDP-4-amino-4,6-dideoxygalactose transaminase